MPRFVCAQGWRACCLPGQLWQCLLTLTGKKHFLMLRTSCVSVRTDFFKLISLLLAFKYFYTFMRFHLSLVFSSLKNLGCHVKCPSPSIFMAPCWPSCSSSVTLLSWGAQSRMWCSRCVLTCALPSFSDSCFPVAWLQHALTAAWGCLLSVGLGISPAELPQVPDSPFSRSSGWKHSPLVHQPLLPVVVCRLRSLFEIL